jgi:hypothetical protein
MLAFYAILSWVWLPMKEEVKKEEVNFFVSLWSLVFPSLESGHPLFI